MKYILLVCVWQRSWLQFVHFGGSVCSIRYECVKRVCPVTPLCNRLYVIWSFHWYEVPVQSGVRRYSCIYLVEFILCLRVPSLLPLVIIIVLIIGLRSVYGIGIWKIGLFKADLAALSAFSLPEIPTWLGSQQNIILKE